MSFNAQVKNQNFSMPVMSKNVVVQKGYNTNFLGKQSVDTFEKK